MKHFMRSITWMLGLSMAGILGIALILSATTLYLSPNLPTVDSLRDVTLQIPLKIYTADNKLIAEYGDKRREPVKLNQVPPLFISALLAAEDKNFYQHHGIDLKGLLRASYELITTGHKHSGGSTITMQVARNYFLTNQQTFSRKFKEILLAIKIERLLDKEEILSLYVNKIYLGNRAYGIGAAAKIYYDKELSELSLAQLAMLAGLPKAPSRFNPVVDPERTLIRRNWILERMYTLNLIDQQQYQTARAEPLGAHVQTQAQDIQALYVAEMVRQELFKRFGEQAYEAGYSVITTIDSRLQSAASHSISQGLLAYDQRHGYRGPEAKVAVWDEQEDAIAYAKSVLAPFSDVNELMPAVVTQSHAREAQALLKDGTAIQLNLEQVRWARKYHSEDRIGSVPKQVSDLLKAGDIIRVIPIETQSSDPLKKQVWRLAQIPKVQGALIAIDPNTGAIQSLIGGFNYQLSNFNRVTQAKRQVGSSIKPFIYSAALSHGYTAASIINDAPIVFQNNDLDPGWRPENSTGTFLGPIRLRRALYESRNLVSIRLLNQLGIDYALDYLKNFGFDTTQFPRDLSLALGSAELTPLTLASGYTVLANGGYKVEPYFINSILDAQGRTLYQANPAKICRTCPRPGSEIEDPSATASAENAFLLDDQQTPPPPVASNPAIAMNQAPQVVDERVVYIMRSMLQDVITRGTGYGAKVLGRRDIAGKTGTTNDQKDAWFSGFNNNLVASVWIGFDTPSTLGHGEYGADAALPIWVNYMRTALAGKPDVQAPMPPGLITVRIDPTTGLRVPTGQKNAIPEIFIADRPPITGTEATSSSTADETSDDQAPAAETETSPTTPPPPPMEQLF